MSVNNRVEHTGRGGSTLVTAVILLGVASFAVGAMVTVSMSYVRHSRTSYGREKAAFLADAGLRAAMVKLNAVNEGNISLNQSRNYFSDTRGLDGALWGFGTRVSVVNGTNVLISTGIYAEQWQEVQAAVTLGAGSRSIHALYAHACFSGNSSGATNYVFQVGGIGTAADFVKGDVYSGRDIDLSGSAKLRLPEYLNEIIYDGIYDPNTETWQDAFAVQSFTNPLPKAQYDTYVASVASYVGKFYNNGRYDYGEPYVDTIGNGVYDVGEPFTDGNGNGTRDAGDGYIDNNHNGYYNAGIDTIIDYGNGQYDTGEEWTEDQSHSQRINGRYDPQGGYWLWSNNTWAWKTSYKVNKKTYYCSSWPAEVYEDNGNHIFDPGEVYVDQNGIYDVGEEYLDDRNGEYDYGTQAYGRITGMPTPGPGQRSATGSDPYISPPDLVHMYYNVNRSDYQPAAALERWGNDVAVTASDYGTAIAITDANRPEHIFIRNPPKSGSQSSGGKTIQGRSYSKVYNNSGQAIDDYFFEDPTDSTYNSSVSGDSIDGTTYTAPMYINVKAQDNVKLYYVAGNVYLHHPSVYSMRFRQPDTRITIVALGNITLSDEFYYKADYDPDLTRDEMNSTVVNNPSDALCLIALKNPVCADSGNIYIGDAQFGTGGSIHAMLYAENNFIDNNLNTASQPFISIFGNMTAGNQVQIKRQSGSGYVRTRLDVSLDERIRNGEIIVPGLPHPVGNQRSIQVDTAWHVVTGSWRSWSKY